jgi:hypothetical protein
MATKRGSVFELIADGKKIMTLIINEQAGGLELMACFNVLKNAFDSVTWQNPQAIEAFEEQDPTTGKTIRLVRASG